MEKQYDSYYQEFIDHLGVRARAVDGDSDDLTPTTEEKLLPPEELLAMMRNDMAEMRDDMRRIKYYYSELLSRKA